MGNSPESRSKDPNNQERVHRSVRVFAVAPISTDKFCELLESGATIENFPLIDVILSQKADTKLLTGIGGEILEGEDLVHAAMRKVFEKSLLTRESRSNLNTIGEKEEPYPYTMRHWYDGFTTFTHWLTGKEHDHREAYLTVMSVRSASFSLHTPREDDDGGSVYKVKRLVKVTPRELEVFFAKGSVARADGETYTMFGHLTQAQSHDVSLSPDARVIQEHAFDDVVDQVYAYDHTLRTTMLTQINRVRAWHGQKPAEGLEFCDNKELEKGFLAAQWTMGMTDEKLRDKKIHAWEREKSVTQSHGHTDDTEKPKEKPSRTSDLLTAALFLKEFEPEDLPDALVSTPTTEVLHAVNVAKFALRTAVIELYDRMSADITNFSSNHTAQPSTINPVTALQKIWPDFLKLPVGRQDDLLGVMDEWFIHALSMRTNKPYDIIKRAMEMPDKLPRYIAGELQPKKDTFQEHHPTNEAASAIERPFVQMLHVLGLHPYVTIPRINEAVIRTRGEIFMHEAITFADISAAERHMETANSLFERGMATFFEQPPEPDVLYLRGIPHNVWRRRMILPINGHKYELWNDKRLVKTEERMLLKSISESNKAIHDDFTHNFVFLDRNFSSQELIDIPARLKLAQELPELLVTHFRQIYTAAEGWRVSIVEDTYKDKVLENVKKFISLESKRERQKLIRSMRGGKRAGSVGDLLVRLKFVLSISNGTKEHRTEVCVYPLETIDIQGTPLYKSGLFGFIQKLEDDASGRHGGDRLILVDPDDPTAPSALEMIQPAVLDPRVFDTIKLHQHRPRKKKK